MRLRYLSSHGKGCQKCAHKTLDHMCTYARAAPTPTHTPSPPPQHTHMRAQDVLREAFWRVDPDRTGRVSLQQFLQVRILLDLLLRLIPELAALCRTCARHR